MTHEKPYMLSARDWKRLASIITQGEVDTSVDYPIPTSAFIDGVSRYAEADGTLLVHIKDRFPRKQAATLAANYAIEGIYAYLDYMKELDALDRMKQHFSLELGVSE